MRKRLIPAALSLVSLAVCLTSCGRRQEVPGTERLTAPAKQFVELLANDNFTTAFGKLNDTMKQAMPPQQLEGAWRALITQAGQFKRQIGVRTTKEQGFDCVYVTCEFEKKTMDVKVVFDRAQRIGGLWFVPSQL